MAPVKFEEVEAIIDRSTSLVEQGVLAGVQDVSRTAIYIAATELVEKLDFSRLVQLIKEGLDEAAVLTRKDLVNQIALFVLIHLASQENGRGFPGASVGESL